MIPRLTSSPTIYGIYSVCISAAIYLSYADIGFLKAGVKYATEYFALKNRKKEQEFLGFSIFILSIFVGIIALGFYLLSRNPEFLIKGLNDGFEKEIASKLLLIQAIFSFNVLLQRFVDSVFGIRLENYISQRIRIVVSVLKIASVFYFFAEDNYDVVGYFLFFQSIDTLGHLCSLFLIWKKYDYDLAFQLKCFKFNREIFGKVKSLAFGSFYVTITWLLYYELDQVAIGKLIGAEAVAIYALGFTLLTYYRTLSGIIFSPFQARFNHFVGLDKISELKVFYLSIVKATMPAVVLTVIPILLLVKPFIFSWVGEDFESSIPIATSLIASNLFLFINVPGSYIIMSFERVKELYVINTVIAIVFWLGIYLFIDTVGILSFAIFKFVAAAIAMVFYLKVALRFIEIKLKDFLDKVIVKLIPSILVQVLVLLLLRNFLPLEKSLKNLLMVLFIAALSIVLALITYYFVSKDIRHKVKGILSKVQRKS